MPTAHIVEVGDLTAGIVVLERDGFRFFASERAFDALEGTLFRTPAQATRAAKDRLRARRSAAHQTHPEPTRCSACPGPTLLPAGGRAVNRPEQAQR